jgi:transcriptional regulator with XRE-family HTH domain
VEKRAARPIDPEAQRIGVILRAIRTEKGLTQEEVADKLPTGEGAYAAYEAGRSRFTIPDLPSIARALGVPTPYLSRRLGLCGDNTDLNALLLEFAGPDIAPLVATALTKYPDLDGQRRAFFVHALQSL